MKLLNLTLPSSNVVVILPDSHAHPDLDNNRYSALGNYLLELVLGAESAGKEVTLVNIGDMADMPSLSSYDKGKKAFEGRRYKADVAAVVDAQEKLFGPLRKEAARRVLHKKRRVHMNTLHLLGNHDDGRINRVTELHPELDGTISISDLQYNKYWDIVIPFKDAAVINDVIFSHYFTTGVKGSPVGGENPARQLILKNHMSSVQGHTHTWDLRELATRDGGRVFGLVAGAYVHPEMIAGWNADTAHFWNNRITVLEDMHDGKFANIMCLSQESILGTYL